MNEKISQEHARYRPFSVGGAWCFNCRFHNKDETCQKVEGQISPYGACVEWSKKAPTELDKAIGKMLRGE